MTVGFESTLSPISYGFVACKSIWLIVVMIIEVNKALDTVKSLVQSSLVIVRLIGQ